LDDRLAALKAKFLDRCRSDLPMLEAAAADPQAADVEALRFCVHRLAGAAGTFGYKDLSRAAGEADDELVLGRSPTRAQLERVIRLLRAEIA
jgi:HPt (histidine-containing phosphotransfer) domain-containing protein